MIDNEIDFAISKIKYAIDNESVWNYLRAIIKHDLLQYEKGTFDGYLLLYRGRNIRVVFQWFVLWQTYGKKIKNVTMVRE